MPQQNIIWQPQERQALFQARSEYEALYGGAAGGGKSDALLTEALRQVHIPHYRGILLRKTVPELSALIDRSQEIYRGAFSKAEYQSGGRVWRFPSGAQIFFGNMQHESDRQNYQGRSYDFIGFDELTHFTWGEYSYMFSRNRPLGPGTRVYIRAATNPGGVGHAWVKERFVTPAPPMTPILEQIRVKTPKGQEVVTVRSRIFIPSTIFDNKVLLENDPAYLANLAMLPEAEKAALLYGSWDSFDGQVFTEWRNDPARHGDGTFTHVIKPFRIPPYWNIYRSFDFGYAKPFSVGWFAADSDGRLYHIKEYYGAEGPDKGVRLNPAEIAANIKAIEQSDENLRGRRIAGVADPSIFDESRGESIARMMCRSPNFIYFSPGDNTRLAGKMQVHYRLAFSPEGESMLYVFDTCRHFIRTIPALCYSGGGTEDVDTRGEDHAYDMLRYMLMENPIAPPRRGRQEERVWDDPLNLNKTL